MCKAPEQRYQTAAEMEAELEAALALPASGGKRPSGGRRAIGLALLGLAAAAVLLGIVFLFETDSGTVRIELSDPRAQVSVQVDGGRIDIGGLKESLRLRVGEHKLRVEAGEYQSVSESFTVRSGKEGSPRDTGAHAKTWRGGAFGATAETAAAPVLAADVRHGDVRRGGGTGGRGGGRLGPRGNHRRPRRGQNDHRAGAGR